MSSSNRPAGNSGFSFPLESHASAFCAACWREMPVAVAVCPSCGASAASLSLRSYEEKLWSALRHPIGDVRERAAVLLGKVCGPDARRSLLVLAEGTPGSRSPTRARAG
jgi:hypothetical protein